MPAYSYSLAHFMDFPHLFVSSPLQAFNSIQLMFIGHSLTQSGHDFVERTHTESQSTVNTVMTHKASRDPQRPLTRVEECWQRPCASFVKVWLSITTRNPWKNANAWAPSQTYGIRISGWGLGFCICKQHFWVIPKYRQGRGKQEGL